jgi:hypothetical protein
VSTLRVGNLEAPGGTGTITVPVNNVLTQAGTILQVVSATKTDSFTTTSTSMVDVTGLSVSITPRSASNSIIVLVSSAVGNNNASELAVLNLVRGSTNIAQSTGSGTANQTSAIYTANTSSNSGVSIVFLDSPATTSATTYKIQARTVTGGTMVLGRFAANDNFRSVSTIMVLEVAG